MVRGISESLGKASMLCVALLVLSCGSGVAMADDAVIVLPADRWQLVTDGVMGGVSQGRLASDQHLNEPCTRLTGAVSTENNGGFIQMAQDVSPADAAKLLAYSGVRIVLSGNTESYNLHLRTTDLRLPWQSYRATVEASVDWQVINLPFADFVPYKTDMPFVPSRLARIGVVAIGRAFQADVCVAQVSFYR